MCQTTNPRAHLTNISYHKDELKLKPFSVCIQKPAQSQLLGHASRIATCQPGPGPDPKPTLGASSPLPAAARLNSCRVGGGEGDRICQA